MVNNILSDGLLIDFLGEKPFFIFPGNTYGGHEIMSLEIINVLYNNGCYITIAVESTNEKLISAVYEKFPNADVIYLPLKQVRFEFIHTILNGYRIFKACNFLKKITTRKYSRIVLIQGDIELGSIYIKAAGILNLAIVSYIPYAHSAKKMYKRLALLRDLYYPRLFLKVSTFITISDVFRKDILLVFVDLIIKARSAVMQCRAFVFLLPFRVFSFCVFYSNSSISFSSMSLSNWSLHRYFLVSCTMIPLRQSREIRFGIAIKAFMQSAMFQTSPRLMTLPRKIVAI